MYMKEDYAQKYCCFFIFLGIVKVIYNELLDIQAEIAARMGSAENPNSIPSQQNDVFSYVTGVYVDDENNGLVVQIRDLDDSKIADLRLFSPEWIL